MCNLLAVIGRAGAQRSFDFHWSIWGAMLEGAYFALPAAAIFLRGSALNVALLLAMLSLYWIDAISAAIGT